MSNGGRHGSQLGKDFQDKFLKEEELRDLRIQFWGRGGGGKKNDLCEN